MPDTLSLYGRPDATGSWARHGRRVERAVLEMLASAGIEPREVRGQLTLGDRACRFRWSGETLALLGASPDLSDPPERAPSEDLPDRVAATAAALRRARDLERLPITVRRAAHLVGAAEGICLPHLEVRDGDASLYLRVLPPEALAETAERLESLRGRVPLFLIGWPEPGEAVTLCRPGGPVERCAPEGLLEALRPAAPGPALRTAA
jgi:hypothetical protein